MNIKEMLEFVMRGLVKLGDEERIRSEGNTTYQEIKQELATAIANVSALVATPPAIVYPVMTADQVAEVVAAASAKFGEQVMTAQAVAEMVNSLSARAGQTEAVMSARIDQAETYLADRVGAARTEVRADIEASDLTVLSSVADTRAELLAAINAPPA